ncbi:MAG: S26 family signal peptidase [Nanoarchaeota archaeon]
MKTPEYKPERVRSGNVVTRFWAFLKKDTWQSWVVSLILLVVLIRFILFPALSFATGSSLPLVVIESCSLYHESDFDEWWNKNAAWYEVRGISKSEFREFPYKNGLNKGDIIFVWGRATYETGEIIIFEPNPESTAKHPIIHRIVSENPYATKGDHNSKQLTLNNNVQRIDETNISEERIIGKSVMRIPVLGWIKLIFFEPLRPVGERGFCK